MALASPGIDELYVSSFLVAHSVITDSLSWEDSVAGSGEGASLKVFLDWLGVAWLRHGASSFSTKAWCFGLVGFDMTLLVEPMPGTQVIY